MLHHPFHVNICLIAYFEQNNLSLFGWLTNSTYKEILLFYFIFHIHDQTWISELKGSTSKDETIQIRITTLDSNYQDILYMILHYSLPYHIAEPVTLSLSITLRLKRPLH